MFSTAEKLVQSRYYGYLNSDILLQPTIFDVLHFCHSQVEKGMLSPSVGWYLVIVNYWLLIIMITSSMRWLVGYMNRHWTTFHLAFLHYTISRHISQTFHIPGILFAIVEVLYVLQIRMNEWNTSFLMMTFTLITLGLLHFLPSRNVKSNK